MPWYYSSADAKPVGPVSLDELHARRLSGAVTPETYVIEHTGQPTADWAWKRYKEIFPASPTLPPTPLGTSLPPIVPAISTPPPVAPPAHPLFPSAAPSSGLMPPPVHSTSAAVDPYYRVKSTNGWCGWGFALGLVGFFLSFACGFGIIFALPALLVSIVGLAQVMRNRNQSGQGLAVAGLILSCAALIVSLAFILSFAIPIIKAHEQTATEQTSNDSE